MTDHDDVDIAARMTALEQSSAAADCRR